MNISASSVKELRERTGAGMMECKKALLASNGDIDAAIEAMRKAGTAKAAKKAGRIAAEGLIVVKTSADNKQAAMVEVNCETDFVARDTHFKEFVDAVASVALKIGTTDIIKLAETHIDNNQSIEQARQELINKVGENVQIRRAALLKATGIVGAYVHSGRIGAIVSLSIDNAELAKNIAMHIAASNPQVIHPEQVSKDLIAHEKEIFTAQTIESGKPADIVEKMVSGRINKFANEISLTGQAFVKDPSKTVGQLLKEAKAEVVEFVRFEVGEGIEKVVEDFAEAVKAQISGGA